MAIINGIYTKVFCEHFSLSRKIQTSGFLFQALQIGFITYCWDKIIGLSPSRWPENVAKTSIDVKRS